MVPASSSSFSSFDFIAPWYDSLARAVYGNAQRQAQSHFLGIVPENARVLILGGGTGWLLEELFLETRPAQVLYLEASGNMLRLAQQRMQPHAAYARIEFRQGTERALLPQEKFHVIMTPFVLDLFTPTQVIAMVQRLNQALLPQGVWLHTDFQLSTSNIKKIWQRPLLWAMYRFFGRVSGISASELAPLEAIFQESGFKCRHRKLFFQEFIQALVLQK